MKKGDKVVCVGLESSTEQRLLTLLRIYTVSGKWENRILLEEVSASYTFNTKHFILLPPTEQG